jgi:hypothetical protein
MVQPNAMIGGDFEIKMPASFEAQAAGQYLADG